MLPYKVEKNTSGLYDIIETSKDNEVIRSFEQLKEAKAACKQMNLGNMGFDGWTPTFVLKSVAVPDIEYEDEDEDDGELE